MQDAVRKQKVFLRELRVQFEYNGPSLKLVHYALHFLPAAPNKKYKKTKPIHPIMDGGGPVFTNTLSTQSETCYQECCIAYR